MKIINKFLLVVALGTGMLSCKKDFLDEIQVSDLSTTNAFTTAADFDASMVNIYRMVRDHFYTQNDFNPFNYQYRTDGFLDMQQNAPNLPSDVQPNGGFTSFAWTPMYKIIAESNTIISRLPASALTAAQKLLFEARARFFRGFSYRTLAHLYGGVPLVLEEITVPKTDFTRATRKAV